MQATFAIKDEISYQTVYPSSSSELADRVGFFERSSIPFNLMLFGGVMAVCDKARNDKNVLRRSIFITRLSKQLGNVIMSQIEGLVDRLIEEGYLRLGATKEIDLTQKIVDEFILLKKWAYLFE